MSQLSKGNLLKGLQNTKKYKNTQPFLQKIYKNKCSDLESLVSEAMIQILSSDKYDMMSKLQVLRFLKDVIMTGNMKFVQALDPKINQNVFRAGAFNSKFKKQSENQNRGDDYFVQVLGMEREKKSKQLGNSYVLFATQIIQFLGKNYPKDMVTGEQTKYYQFYEILKKLGIQFKNVYFQKQQVQTFRANVQTLSKKLIKKEKGKKDKDESSKRNQNQSMADTKRSKLSKTERDLVIEKEEMVEKIEQNKESIESKKQKQRSEQKRRNSSHQKQQKQKEKKKQELKQKQKERQKQKQKKVTIKTSSENSKVEAQQIQKRIKQKYQNRIAQLERELQRQVKNKQQALTQKDKQMQTIKQEMHAIKQQNVGIKKQYEEIKNCNKNNKELFQKLQAKDKQLKHKQNTISDKTNTIRDKQAMLEEKEKVIKDRDILIKQNKTKLQSCAATIQEKDSIIRERNEQICKIQKEITHTHSHSQQSNNSNIKYMEEICSKDKIIKQLQTDKVKLQRIVREKQQQMHIISQHNQQLQRQNRNIKEQSQKIQQQRQRQRQRQSQKQRQRQRQKENNNKQNTIINIVPNQQNIIHQPQTIKSLRGSARKQQPILMQTTNTHTHNIPTNNVHAMNSTVPNSFGINPRQPQINTKMMNTDYFMYRKSSTSVSMMKTQTMKMRSKQSQSKERKNSIFTRERERERGNSNQLLSKTTSPLNNQNNKYHKYNGIVINFPFIKEYFQPIKTQNSQHFRACCFINKRRVQPFYSDPQLSLVIQQQHNSQHTIYVSNKCNISIRVHLQLQPQKYDLKIQGKHYKQIKQNSTQQFRIVGQITNINFRFPIVKIKVDKNQRRTNYKMPIPITLFSFCQFPQPISQKIKHWEENNTTSMLRIYKGQKFVLNQKRRNLIDFFSFLNFQNMYQALQFEGILTYKFLPQIRLRVILRQMGISAEVEIHSSCTSKSSQAFAKVLIQIMQFLLI